MKQTVSDQRPAFRATGALAALVLSALCAPSRAEGGCSYLVTSRTDPQRAAALIAPLMHDLSLDVDEPTGPMPMPSRPRPCSGAFCSGQPPEPSAPTAVVQEWVDDCALAESMPGSASTGGSPLSMGTSHPCALRRGIAIFRPPRLLRSA